jgi:hypothetical protein
MSFFWSYQAVLVAAPKRLPSVNVMKDVNVSLSWDSILIETGTYFLTPESVRCSLSFEMLLPEGLTPSRVVSGACPLEHSNLRVVFAPTKDLPFL